MGSRRIFDARSRLVAKGANPLELRPPTAASEERFQLLLQAIRLGQGAVLA